MGDSVLDCQIKEKPIVRGRNLSLASRPTLRYPVMLATDPFACTKLNYIKLLTNLTVDLQIRFPEIFNEMSHSIATRTYWIWKTFAKFKCTFSEHLPHSRNTCKNISTLVNITNFTNPYQHRKLKDQFRCSVSNIAHHPVSDFAAQRFLPRTA